MTPQKLTIGNRKFVIVPEREFNRLQKRAGERAVREGFGDEAMSELNTYRKTGKAIRWSDAKRKLGL